MWVEMAAAFSPALSIPKENPIIALKLSSRLYNKINKMHMRAWECVCACVCMCVRAHVRAYVH